jgi:DNA-binding MarR family transcriptional regulator
MEHLIEDSLLEIILEIRRIHGRIRTLFDDVELATSLPKMEVTVLTAVAEARTPPTVAALGRILGHPRQVVQRASKNLISGGYLESHENPEHKTARVLVPTERGLASKALADECARDIAAMVGMSLDVEKCEAVASYLRVVRQAIDRHLRKRSREQSRAKLVESELQGNA